MSLIVSCATKEPTIQSNEVLTPEASIAAEPKSVNTFLKGTLLEGFIGQSIESALHSSDMMYYSVAQDKAYLARINEKVSWTNPRNGHTGTITITREGVSSAGSYCREFHQKITIHDESADAYGTACQQPDGLWRIVGTSQ